MNHEVQSFKTLPHEDEIDLRKTFFSLKKYRKFIFSFVAVPTFIAFIFWMTFEKPPQIYKSQTNFVPPFELSIVNVNRVGLINVSRESVFNVFLTMITSESLQEKVFLEGDFFSKLNINFESVSDQKLAIKKFTSKLILEEAVIWNPDLKDEYQEAFLDKVDSHYERPYSLSIEGYDANALVDYLDLLFIAANNKIRAHFIQLISEKIKYRLDDLDSEINEHKKDLQLIQMKKIQNLKNKIEDLTFDSSLAQQIGTADSNYTKANFENIFFNTSQETSINNPIFIDWKEYGENIINKKIKLLENRLSSISNEKNSLVNVFLMDKKLQILENRKLKLMNSKSNMNNDMELFYGAQLKTSSSSSKVDTKYVHPIIFLLLAFFGSLISSIFMALIYDFFRIEPIKK
jgi:hypothetical protein